MVKTMNDLKFRKPWHRVKVPSNVGSRVHTLYSPSIKQDGSLVLEESGVINTYDEIQSHAESVDINVLLRKYAAGDLTALSKRQGSYGDFTQLPKSYAELLDNVIKGKAYFDSLPLSVRDSFGHDFNRWLSTAGQPEWYEAMGKLAKSNSTPEIIEQIVKDGASDEQK